MDESKALTIIVSAVLIFLVGVSGLLLGCDMHTSNIIDHNLQSDLEEEAGTEVIIIEENDYSAIFGDFKSVGTVAINNAMYSYKAVYDWDGNLKEIVIASYATTEVSR